MSQLTKLMETEALQQESFWTQYRSATDNGFSLEIKLTALQ